MSAIELGIRAGFVAIAVALWFWSQAKISERKAPLPADGGIGDRLHTLTAPWNAWLAANPRAADKLLIATSAGIDMFAVYLLAAAIFGATTQPLIALVIVFTLRQLCEMLVALPEPPGVIWRYPGFPSLLVTYHVENDFFFSGHTAVSVVGALQLIHFAPTWVAALAVILATIEAVTVIVLRAHYTMDVFAAIAAACVADVAAGRLAPALDSFL